MKLLISAVLAMSAALTASQTRPPTNEQITEAVGRVPRLAPDRFTALPPTARDTFNKIGCAVPQTSATGSPQNVIAGQFAAKGQQDYAALCSNGTDSVVRVAWGGPARCDEPVGARQDSESITLVAPAVIAYDRTIAPASVEHIGRALVRFRQQLPEPPTHDAIEDSNKKVPALYYCHNGRWLTMPSS